MKSYFSTLNSLITLVVLCTLLSCGNNRLDVDTSNIKVDLKVKRFDQELFNYPKGITAKDVVEMNTAYGLFFQDFTQSVINIGSPKKDLDF